MMSTHIYTQTKKDNEKHVAAINAAWGEDVAWVEDRALAGPAGGTVVLPVIVSKLVRGCLPGRSTTPAFFAGPATGVAKPRAARR